MVNIAKKAGKRDREAPCPIMRACGGCEWLGLPYRKQLARKQTAMEELFRPFIQVDDIVPDPSSIPVEGREGARLISPRAFRYKAATPFAPGPHKTVRSGFFERGSHRITPCPACAVEAPGARRILDGVARLAERLGISAYDEDKDRGTLRHAVVRMGWKSNEALVTIVTRQKAVPRLQELAEAVMGLDARIVGVAQNVNPRRTNAILGGETIVLRGEARMRDSLLGCTFEISPVSFYQTNPAQTEALYSLAIEGMALHDGDTLMDAYCGSGTIGLCAAAAARDAGKRISLIGVERNPEGVRDAMRNAELNNLAGHSAFKAQDATEFMRRAVADGLRIDVLSMDPPRAGSTPEFLAAAAALNPRRISYISCNPETQARDLRTLAVNGYRLLRLTPVDMFPHTAHVETVAVMERAR